MGRWVGSIVLSAILCAVFARLAGDSGAMWALAGTFGATTAMTGAFEWIQRRRKPTTQTDALLRAYR